MHTSSLLLVPLAREVLAQAPPSAMTPACCPPACQIPPPFLQSSMHAKHRPSPLLPSPSQPSPAWPSPMWPPAIPAPHDARTSNMALISVSFCVSLGGPTLSLLRSGRNWRNQGSCGRRRQRSAGEQGCVRPRRRCWGRPGVPWRRGDAVACPPQGRLLWLIRPRPSRLGRRSYHLAPRVVLPGGHAQRRKRANAAQLPIHTCGRQSPTARPISAIQHYQHKRHQQGKTTATQFKGADTLRSAERAWHTIGATQPSPAILQKALRDWHA
jgi:hypothetical protein